MLGISLPGYSQSFGVKPTFAYNFHKINGLQTHSFGGGFTFEDSFKEGKGSIHFSLLYFGGKGTLTEEGYQKWFDDSDGPQNPNKIAKRNNLDMAYLSAGQRFYLGDSDGTMNGANIGYSIGYGLPTQDNPFGYYWDISAQLGYQYFITENKSIDFFAKVGFGSWTYDVDYFRVIYGYDDTYTGLNFRSESMFFLQTGVSIGLFK